MDSNAPDNSSISLDTIRKSLISRRGGVRVRGGRLPPIRIRDITPSPAKKVIAPKIPQRRIRTEKQSPEPSVKTPVFSKDERKDNRKPFSRGRGQRVYIQTEGSFLEQGPALRLKKETVEPHYERTPRSSSRIKNAFENKINAAQIHLLLEGYDETDAYLDDENDIQPVQIPFTKMESKPKIKEETLGNEVKLKIKEEIIDDEDVQVKIKEEILDDEDVKPKIKEGILDGEELKPKIKKEPEDDPDEKNKNCNLPEVKSTKQEMSEPKFRSLMEALKLSEDEDVFVLFQLPSCLPFKRFDESSDQTSKTARSSIKHEEVEKSQDEEKGINLEDIPEGSVGKLQIMKSGRARLALGSIDVALISAMNEGGTSEAVSIPLKNKDSGNFIILGNIYQKMIMFPILTESEQEIKSKGASE